MIYNPSGIPTLACPVPWLNILWTNWRILCSQGSYCQHCDRHHTSKYDPLAIIIIQGLRVQVLDDIQISLLVNAKEVLGILMYVAL